MKKIFYSMMALAIAALTFTACEDVPEPYNNPLDNQNTGGGETETIEPAGTGTVADPFNVAAAINYVNELGADVTSTADVYISGIITSVNEEYSTQYGNARFVISDDEKGSNKFTFYRGLYLGNKKYTGGTNVQVGDKVVICGKVVLYGGSTPETSQNNAYLYSLNGETGGSTPTPTPGEAKGDGTLANPFNAVAAIAYAQSVGEKESDKEVYIQGKVSTITEQYGTQFGNATFNISDDGTTSTTEFTVYRALYLGNKKYTSGDLLNVGDNVIVCGKVTNFRGDTPETVTGKAYLYSLNGKTEGGTTPDPTPGGEAKGTGSKDDPFNVQAIINYVSALAADVDTKADYYVKGIVTEIPSGNNGISTQYNNVSFYISDDKSASNKFYVFRAKGLNGGDVTENMIKVGDEVIIFGSTWVNFKGNTPETKQGEAYIVSITDGGGGTGGGGGETPDGYAITLADFGLGNASDLTTLTASDGTTLTFAQEDGTNAPKYYTSGAAARMYAKNSLTIKGSKTITKVVLTCAMNGANPANGNSQMYGEAGGSKVTVSKDSDTQVTLSGFSNQTLKIVNDYTDVKAGTQLRISKITITYAN